MSKNLNIGFANQLVVHLFQLWNFWGAGLLHRINGVSTPKAVPFNGKISLIAGLVFMLFISVYYSRKKNIQEC